MESGRWDSKIFDIIDLCSMMMMVQSQKKKFVESFLSTHRISSSSTSCLRFFFFKNFSRIFFRTVEIQVTFKPWCVNLCKNHDFYKTMTYSAIFYISHSKKLLLSMSWVLYIVKIMVTAMLDPHVFIKFELLQKTLIKMRIDVNQPVDKPSITLK